MLGRVDDGDGAALVTVIPKTSPDDEKTTELVTRLRDDVVPQTLGEAGIDAKIGGVTAALEDQSEYMVGRMPLFIAGVVGLSFLLLLIAFHSPLISLKAAVMNLLSVGAAVFNLRLAMALDGWLPVLRSFPADGVTVARVEPGRPGKPGPGLRNLGTAVFRRHTNRGPYARAVIPARIIDELRAAAATEESVTTT